MGDLGSIPGLGRSSGYMDLTEAEDINKRWQVYTEEDPNDPDNQDGVISHLEPDILECEIKSALEKHHYEQS